MHKILLIIKREYITRVRKKSFIIMTILGPLLFASFLLVPVWLASLEGEEKVVEVLDESGLFENKFPEAGSLKFKYIKSDLSSAKEKLPDSNTYGLLYIPKLDLQHPAGITFFAEGNPSFEVVMSLEKSVRDEIEDIKLEQSGIDKKTLEDIKTRVEINTINLSETGEKESSSGVSSVAGYAGALLIYFFVFLYGAQIMRGVLEEKTSRIVEVIISSVKPFQLMTGKIVGIAAVGLSQFLLWVIFTLAITFTISAVFGIDSSETTAISQNMQGMPGADAAQAEQVSNIMSALSTLDFTTIILCFIFYFLGGYLLYGALFAAVGSAVDSDADTQQFMLPLSLPLILSIMTLWVVIKDPGGSLAFWLSMVPFTSPVVMMMRVPFGVPLWQLLLSMLILIGGFIFTTWLAGRVYRIGILMHGTKINYRVLGKWLFMKG